jgi:hypothetical protein
MGMNSVGMDLVTQRQKLSERGVVVMRNYLHPDNIFRVHVAAMDTFRKADGKQGLIFPIMRDMFKEDRERFINCGKQIQHNIDLWQLAVSNRIVDLLHELGLERPNICTRPVLYFNHPDLAEEPIYNSVPAHQDWRSMQGSLNSLVVWIPLVDCDRKNGTIRVLPGSHKQGLLPGKLDHGFWTVDLTPEQQAQMVDVDVKVGDLVVFNAFLVHASGDNQSDEPRWSCHFRYNDLNEQTFINRGYPNPYIYRPIAELVTPDFP